MGLAFYALQGQNPGINFPVLVAATGREGEEEKRDLLGRLCRYLLENVSKVCRKRWVFVHFKASLPIKMLFSATEFEILLGPSLHCSGKKKTLIVEQSVLIIE